MSNYRHRFTPTLKLYYLERLSLLLSIGNDNNLYNKLTLRQSASEPLYGRDGEEIRPPRFFDPGLPAFVAVLDIEPTANLGHPHLYRVWQVRKAERGYTYAVQAEPFFHNMPLDEREGVTEIEPEEIEPESDEVQP